MVRRMLMLLSLLGAAAVAHGHAQLVESSPADKSRVAAPAAVELKFSAAVKLTALTLQQGKQVARPLTPLPGQAGTSLSVPLPKLAAGDYLIAWRAASDDGHVVSGQLGFTVDPAAGAATPGGNQGMHQGMGMGDHSQMDHAQHMQQMQHMQQH